MRGGLSGELAASAPAINHGALPLCPMQMPGGGGGGGVGGGSFANFSPGHEKRELPPLINQG